MQPDENSFAFLEHFPLSETRKEKIKDLTKDTNFKCLLINLLLQQASKNPITELDHVKAFSEIKSTARLIEIALKSEKL